MADCLMRTLEIAGLGEGRVYLRRRGWWRREHGCYLLNALERVQGAQLQMWGMMLDGKSVVVAMGNA